MNVCYPYSIPLFFSKLSISFLHVIVNSWLNRYHFENATTIGLHQNIVYLQKLPTMLLIPNKLLVTMNGIGTYFPRYFCSLNDIIFKSM